MSDQSQSNGTPPADNTAPPQKSPEQEAAELGQALVSAFQGAVVGIGQDGKMVGGNSLMGESMLSARMNQTEQQYKAEVAGAGKIVAELRNARIASDKKVEALENQLALVKSVLSKKQLRRLKEGK